MLETRVQISAAPSKSIYDFKEKVFMPSKKSRKLTRFERARIIGARALQISMGAKPKVDIDDMLDPIDIATLELKKSVIPLDIRE